MKKDKIKHISRRDFLKLAGVSAGGAASAFLFPSDLFAVPQRVLDRLANGKGLETWQNTVCRQCPGGCGISVRKIDGIPIYVKGNPIYPVNRGGVCPMAHTSMEVLFNPDRLKNPLVRKSSKSKREWDSIEWNEALSSLSKRLKDLINKGEGHRIAIINGDDSPLMRSLCQYWMKVSGSPNYFEDEHLIDHSIPAILSQGMNKTPAYDQINSKYILNFGSNFLEEGRSPVYYQQIFGHIREVTYRERTTLVHIDSRINLTASNSDRWIPIRPGTYGPLALGIAHVLIVDGLYDEAFIEDHTFGFKPFKDKSGRDHIGFETYIRGNYYPEKVSQLTGVPAETIIQLGEEFGTRRPAVAIADDASKYATNGSFTQWAVYCLNALIGNFSKEGGIFFQPSIPQAPFPNPELDQSGKQSLSRPKVGENMDSPTLIGDISFDQFANGIVSSDPGQIDTLIIIDSNPLFHSRQKEKVIKALQKIENVVFIGAFMDETAIHADVILPDHSYLEKNDIHGPVPGLMFGHVGIQQAVLEPLFNTRQSGEVLVALGKEVFDTRLFPWNHYDELVNEHLRAIFESGEGTIMSESTYTEWIVYMKERGWRLQQYQSFETFRKLLVKNGGWWNPINPDRPLSDIFQTLSGKFEFVSSMLQKKLTELSNSVEGSSPAERRDRLLSSLHISARGDDLFMPHNESPFTREKSEEYPLILTVSQLLTNREGRGATQPSLLEMVGIQAGRYWKSWIEINPETGQEFGLKDEESAWVQSAQGRIRADVRFFQGIRPGVVHIHLGLGHTSYGRFGTGIGINVTDIIENNFDSLSNIPALNGTRVKVSPAVKEV